MPTDISERQQRIREDLASEIAGEIRVSPLDRSLYATDASLYQIQPEAVAYPSGHNDVVTLVRYAAENDLPVHCRGAGSGVAGGCLGPGLVLDFSRSMRRLLAVDAAAQTCRVEPGIVRDELNRRLRSSGLYLAPDPANGSIGTVGSMVALDAAGSHRIRFGSTRNHVERLRSVLGDGTELPASRRTDVRSLRQTLATGDVVEDHRLSQLRRLLLQQTEAIEAAFEFRPAAATGYMLPGVASPDRETLDLVQLLVGSEGTLAAVTEIDLRLTPLAAARRALLVTFDSVERALEASLALRDDPPDACDLLDRRLLGLARQVSPQFDPIIPQSSECGLVIDLMGDDEDAVEARLVDIRRRLRAADPSSQIVFEADDAIESERLWEIPAQVLPRLTRLSGDVRPLPFVEDIVLPPERLADALTRIRRVFQRYGATASTQAHVLTGQLHLRPMLAMPKSIEDRQRIEAIARDVYQIVFGLAGTISGEHGDGLSRTAFLRSRFASLYPILREVKTILDPAGQLNPGKIVSDDPRLTVRNVRPPVSDGDRPTLQLAWPKQSFADEADRCTGCGDCRRSDRSTRMCPVMSLDRLEDNSPRSKANAIRGLFDGLISPETFASPEMRSLAERCFNCKQCQLDCPTHVDVPHLMIEAKAAAFGERGLTRADWVLSRAHSLGRIAAPLAPLLNASLASPPIRWLLEKSIGLARRRKLPRFARKPFVQTLRGEVAACDGERGEVVYFVDHYANFHDPELAAATVAVLRHNGLSVRVPAGQQPSGLAMVSAGDLDAARGLATTNLDLFGPLAAEGTPVICTEPAAVLALRDDYPRLVDHPESQSLADAVVDIGHFLKAELAAGRLRTDFRTLDYELIYHTPCHVNALGRDRPLLELLQLVPGLTVRPFELGCSGMAGTYGLSARHYSNSIRIGRRLIRQTREMDEVAATTECSSCKLQMEQGTTKPTVHPIKLLALAYGLMPQLSRSLEPNARRLTVS